MAKITGPKIPKIMLLGGFGYSITHFFRDEPIFEVIAPEHIDWGEYRIDELRGLLPTDGSPVALVGFSDGGTLAHKLAQVDDRITLLAVHSGMFKTEMTERPARILPVRLYATVGDMTPTRNRTYKAFEYYVRWNFPVNFIDLPITDDDGRTYVGDQTGRMILAVMRVLRHEFRNCVPDLTAWIHQQMVMYAFAQGLPVPTYGYDSGVPDSGTA